MGRSVRKLAVYLRGNVIALLALFLALSAGAYAATHAPKDSVVSSSIKNGQVKHSDLSSKAIAGKLFKVKPNKATTLEADPCNTGKAATFCGYNDGGSSDGQMGNVGDGLAPVSFSKDSGGVVRLSGTGGVNSYQATLTVFVLPKDMRPGKQHAYAVPCGQNALDSLCTVLVSKDGTVSETSGTTPFAGLALDSIAFRAGG